MKKRIMAALLSCAMISSVSSVTAFAEDFALPEIEVEDIEKEASFSTDIDVDFLALDEENAMKAAMNEDFDFVSGSKTGFSDLIYDKTTGLNYKIYTDSKGNKTSYVYGNSKVSRSNPNTTLKTLTIPSKIGGYTVTGIGGWGFDYYTALQKVIMPDTVLEIDLCAFEGCYSLSSITFSKNLKHISVSAFQDCVSLTKVILPDSVETIYSEAFDGCTRMSYFHIPTSLWYSGIGYLFKGCPSLKTVNFGKSTALCESVKSNIDGKLNSSELFIPNSVTSITVEGGGKLQTNPKGYTNNNLVMAGFEGSYGQKWAKSNGIPFDIIDPRTLDTKYANVNWRTTLGDIDRDGNVNALDASSVLSEYARVSVGKKATFTKTQKLDADANNDGNVNAVDASLILAYYAYKSTGGKDIFPGYMLTNAK